MITALFILAFCVLGIGISLFAGTFIPLWLSLGFSVIFSIEKWFKNIISKSKATGLLYRFILNLFILFILGLLVYTGIKLFSHQFLSNSLVGSIIFIAEFILFIWLWRVVSKNSWRRPSMKLTVFSLIGLFLILAFAGVQPWTTYKDKAISGIVSGVKASQAKLASNENNQAQNAISTSALSSKSDLPLTTAAVSNLISENKINSSTGVYKNYYLGLVNTPEGDISGDGCYDDTGDFIILINNKNAVNPTYAQLLNFLQIDKTDQYPYQYTNRIAGSYYGTAESHVDLKHIQDIIDGKAQPGNPDVCADFAERLHNDAEMAGIRCAYVSIDLSGYPDPDHLGIPSDTGHALDAFQTTDRGLVYIDDTNSPGPHRCVKTVNVQVGQQYIPQSVFPEYGWNSTWDSVGTVTGIQVIWDGSWNN